MGSEFLIIFLAVFPILWIVFAYRIFRKHLRKDIAAFILINLSIILVVMAKNWLLYSLAITFIFTPILLTSIFNKDKKGNQEDGS